MAGPLRKLQFSYEHAPAPKEGEVENTLTQPLQNVQGTLKETVKRINDTPWTTSRVQSVTFVAATTQAIGHGLGRTPVRWSIEDVADAAWSGYRVSWDDKYISIYSDNASTILLRVE